MKSLRKLRMKLPPWARPAVIAVERPSLLLSRPWRLASAPWRALPDFLVIGAQKAGSSSLYHYLTQHPQIFAAMKKELYYFYTQHFRGERWYRSRFPMRRELRNGGITGEATPVYCVWPHAPRLIRRALPDVKLMIVLRDPVERAISHYFHRVQWRSETLPIMDAMKAEEERLAPHLARMAEDEHYFHPSFDHYSYKLRGRYVEQLQRFHEHFDRDRLLVIDSNELSSNTAAVLRRAYEHLGVDPAFTPTNLERLAVGYNKQPVDDAVRAYLSAYFRPHNQRLYDYLGRDFGW